MAGRGLGGAEAAAKGGGCACSLLDSTRQFSNCKRMEFTLQRTLLPRILYSLIAIGYFAFCEWKRQNWPERKLRRKRSDKCAAHLKVHTHLPISPPPLPSPPPPTLGLALSHPSASDGKQASEASASLLRRFLGPTGYPAGCTGKAARFASTREVWSQGKGFHPSPN